MKKLISVLLIVALVLSLCSCKSQKIAECVASADLIVDEREAESFENQTPYTLETDFDKDTNTYTVTLCVYPADKLDSWIRTTTADAVADAGLADYQREAFYVMFRSEVDNKEKAKELLGLVWLELPTQSFEELGITLKLQYQDQYGGITEIDQSSFE